MQIPQGHPFVSWLIVLLKIVIRKMQFKAIDSPSVSVLKCRPFQRVKSIHWSVRLCDWVTINHWFPFLCLWNHSIIILLFYYLGATDSLNWVIRFYLKLPIKCFFTTRGSNWARQENQEKEARRPLLVHRLQITSPHLTCNQILFASSQVPIQQSANR